MTSKIDAREKAQRWSKATKYVRRPLLAFRRKKQEQPHADLVELARTTPFCLADIECAYRSTGSVEAVRVCIEAAQVGPDDCLGDAIAAYHHYKEVRLPQATKYVRRPLLAFRRKKQEKPPVPFDPERDRAALRELATNNRFSYWEIERAYLSLGDIKAVEQCVRYGHRNRHLALVAIVVAYRNTAVATREMICGTDPE